MNAQQIIANRSLRSEFSTLAIAENFISNCISPSKWKTVLGDNRYAGAGRFWVLSNRDALVLVKAGYEFAL